VLISAAADSVVVAKLAWTNLCGRHYLNPIEAKGLIEMRVKWVLLVCLVATSIVNAQQPSPPIIFFTDLISGPVSGNSDTTYSSTGGAYVTLYGNFLDNYSAVKLNGASCLTVVSGPATWRWYERMIVKLGTACTTGNFSITTPGGTWSGPTVETSEWGRTADFTASSGTIRYVSTSGSDTNSGTFSSPWANPYHAVQTAGLTGGNVIYLMSGSYGATEDGQGWGASLTMRPDWALGTATQPDGLVGYPGVLPTIGCQTTSCPSFAIRSTDTDAWTIADRGYWTFANIAWRASTNGGPVAIAGGSPPGSGCCESRGWRFVATDVSSPTGGNNAVTPFQFQSSSHVQILGNWVHDVVLLATSRLDQSLYLSTDQNYTEVGWNEIYNNGGRGGIQTHSSNLCWPSCSGDQTGWILHDNAIHDNMIHHINEEGILVDTSDPGVPCTQSFPCGIQVYNNVIYDAGLDGSASDAIHMQLSGDFTQTHGKGTSPAPEWWFNNTVYCSTGGEEACWGSWFPDIHPATGVSVTSRLTNNIFYSVNSVPYLAPQNYTGTTCGNTDNFSTCQSASGANDIMYGAGVATYPSLFTGTINSNPLLVSASSFNFQLQSGSPAIGAGIQTISDVSGTKSVSAPAYDINGLIRPNPPSIGAYEFSGAASAGLPNPPTNLSATVN
jgi:hypothetical protein